jgi:hypothetical protein
MSNSSAIRIIHLRDVLHAKAHPVTCARRGQLSAIRAGGRHGNSGPAHGTLAMRRALAAFGATLTLAATASAHDYWADGKPIPNWVKASCCGPADAHHLRPDQVHRVSDDYLRGRRLSSSRSCLTGAAEPGSRLLDFLSRRSERRAVRNVLLLRPHGLLMRDPTPQQIEMVHRMRDARRLIVRASRLPSGWANEAVANGHGKVFWLATAGQLQCLCPQR